MSRIFFYFLLLFSGLPLIALGQQTGSEDSYFFSDLGEYFKAPAHWGSDEWLKFGAITGGVLLVAEQFDDKWKEEIVSESPPYYSKSVEQVGDAWGDMRLSGPFILGVYGYGRWSNDAQYINASHDMLQSVVYTGVMTQVLKETFKRERPNLAIDESGWFGSGSSFPSGHTSVAFAVSRSYLNSLDNPSLATKVLFYGLATSTALARTYENYHWASDVIAGALLGIYTADFVSDRNKDHRSNVVYSPYVSGDAIGVQLNWQLP